MLSARLRRVFNLSIMNPYAKELCDRDNIANSLHAFIGWEQFLWKILMGLVER